MINLNRVYRCIGEHRVEFGHVSMLGSCWVYVGFMSVSIELDWDCGVIYEFPPVFDSDRFG